MSETGTVIDLSQDVPGVVGRRRFLGLLGVGTAAGLFPTGGSAPFASAAPAASPAPGRGRVFEDPPVVPDDPEAILLDQNENPLAPSRAEREALIEALDLANRYPDAEGRLVQMLAAHHGVETRNLLLGCGSTELLKVCADAVCTPGTEMIQASPTYGTMDRYAQLRGAEVVDVPVDVRGRVPMDRMIGKLNTRTRAVYLCNPNNPTGTIIPDTEVQALIGRASDRVLIVSDEAYWDYVDDPGYKTLIPQAVSRPGLVVLRTFSKVYGLAGMRIGYAIAHPDTIRMLSPHRLILDLNNPGIFAAMAALKDETFRTQSIAMNRASRDRIVAEVRKVGGTPIPSQAGFVWIDFGRPTDPIRDALRTEHVYTRTYGHSPNHLRISTGRAADMDRLFAAMHKVMGAGI